MSNYTILDRARELRALLETLAEELPDETAQRTPYAYPAWSGDGVSYTVGSRVRYGEQLYKCLQAHISQPDWEPKDAVSLWAKITPEGVIPEWVQPDSSNPYMVGDKVRYKGKVYESLIDNNVWSPEAYPAGWREVA